MTAEVNLGSDIAWQDGMLLCASHMQFLSEKAGKLAFHHIHSAIPYGFGVRSFSIDKSQIENGYYCLEEIDAILPNGEVLQFFGEDSVILPLPTNAQEISVCVGLKTSSKLENRAYEEHIDYSDENSEPVLLQKPEPTLSILLPSESLGNRILLSQMRFLHGRFVPKAYFPPCVQVSKNSFIESYVSTLLREVREHTLRLSKSYKTHTPSNLANQLERKITLHSLSAGLLAVDAVLKVGLHPFNIYLELCRLLGLMNALNEQLLPPVLPAYDHLNSYQSFKKVAKSIRSILDNLNSNSFNEYDFKKDQSGYRLVIQPEWNTKQITLGIKVENEEHRMEIIRWMMDCRIGHIDDLAFMKKSRTIGFSRTLLSDPPEALSQEDKVFFSVEAKKLQPNQILHLSNPASSVMEPEAIYLHVLTGGNT